LSLLARYGERREVFQARGFRLGRPPIAMLSRNVEHADGVRQANPLFDMDFYSDASRSVYRPRFTIDALRRQRGYRYSDGLLAIEFIECDDGVELLCRDIRNASYVKLFSRRLIVAGGALNTARLVARSLRAYECRLPLLCNPYRYVPAVNVRMLGKPARAKRHSLVQLVGALSKETDDPEQLFVSFYSYRSLLLYKLVKEMPLPPQLGLLAARLLQSSLTVLGIHFPEGPTAAKWIALERGPDAEHDRLRSEYTLTRAETRGVQHGIRELLAIMLDLRLLPLGVFDPGHGASIHYAGPLGSQTEPIDVSTAADGSLRAAGRVFIGDSAAWAFLPAKGPTLTIMAHARNIAANVVQSLAR
jgi:hypothetical protein